jgi:hypothetical protein
MQHARNSDAKLVWHHEITYDTRLCKFAVGSAYS